MTEHLLELLTLHGITSLLTLTVLEIVLGIDNIVFIALIIQHLPKKAREHARRIGLSLALILRVVLLLSISWVLSLTQPFFTAFGHEFSGKDILLLLGGLFLIYKATTSVHDMFTDSDEQALRESKGNMVATIAQIAVIDLVFSFDSVITAVGLTTNIPIIIIAMGIAMLIMLFFTGFVSEFIQTHPSLKTLAISFILLIGVLLVGESFGAHIPRAYIYFAMAFSGAVETVNILIRNKTHKKPKKKR
jgi:predicted tellurium resistance membrane protein TerC